MNYDYIEKVEEDTMGSTFTQGTIIEDIRSKKYPTIRCKGIVISARCDFAQDKIRLFHCLSALTLEEWIYEVLYFNIVDEKKKDILGRIKKYCHAKELDFKTILELDIDRACEILEKSAEKKDKSGLDANIVSWRRIIELSNPKTSREEKSKFLREECKKLLKAKLQQLYNGNFPKYGFIPEKAIRDESLSLVEGLVVDLQDIIQIDIKHSTRIMTYEYDCKVVKNHDIRKEINEFFFFENDDDFVIADSIVKSPWIEHILQLFANSFIRIGVDNAGDYDTEEYCDKLLEEHV